MSSFRKKNNIKWIITFSLLAVLLVGMIFAFVKIDSNQKTKEIGSSSFTYSIGLLDEKGEYKQGTSSIYTKDFYSVDGLEIVLDKDATITYNVSFYDEDKEFISATSELSSDLDVSVIPETAVYFKVEITPENDSEVSFFEISNYAGMLTITINK